MENKCTKYNNYRQIAYMSLEKYISNLYIVFLRLFHCRQDVMRETKCLYTVRDPNLARIVGVCSPDEPLCIIQEYCEYGDLPSFLKVQTTESTEAHPTIK